MKKKVKALALGTGYAESASWSQLFLYHEKGFDSIQEALMSVREALIDLNTEELVEQTLHDIIHGTYQTHGEFWECISERGWFCGVAWNGEYMNKTPVVCVDNAPEMVSTSPLFNKTTIFTTTIPKGISLLMENK